MRFVSSLLWQLYSWSVRFRRPVARPAHERTYKIAVSPSWRGFVQEPAKVVLGTTWGEII